MKLKQKSNSRFTVSIILILACMFFFYVCALPENKTEDNGGTLSTSSNSLPTRPHNADTALTPLKSFQNLAGGDIVVTDLTTIDLETLINKLVGENVTLSNIVYKGVPVAAGIFSNAAGVFGFDEGIILSSGSAKTIIGPNNNDGASTDNNLGGDADLNSLIPGYTTHDACILEFDFVPEYDTIVFDFQFTSEEYNEYVNTDFNDVFGFFLNGANIALIPGTSTPVAINNVNGGNPYGTNASHPELYINNDLSDGGGAINTQMDGMTVVFTAKGTLQRGKVNHIKLAIADAGDLVLDSNILIKAQSFTSDNPPVVTAAVDRPPNANGWYNADVTVSFTAEDTDETPVASVDPPVVVSTEGADQAVTGNAVDTAGLTGSATVNISLDKTAPEVTINSPTATTYIPSGTLTLDFIVSDALSGIDAGSLNALLDGASVTNGQVLDLSTLSGTHTLSVTVSDLAGNSTVKEVVFTVIENAIVDVKPDTLCLKSRCCKHHHDGPCGDHCKGKCDKHCQEWYSEFSQDELGDEDFCGGKPHGHDNDCYCHDYSVTAYIQLQSASPSDIDVATVTLTVNGVTIKAQLKPTAIYDYDHDGILELMVKFDRNAVVAALGDLNGDITMTVQGKLKNGIIFVGSDIVKVIHKL
jgi:hypothetical protein